MKTPVALLLAVSCLQVALGQVDLESQVSVGYIDHRGSRLNVYEVDGVQFAEPNIQFVQSCGTTTYNHVYQKYQISIGVLIGLNALQKTIDDGKKVGRLSISRLEVLPDQAFGSDESKVKLVSLLENQGEAQLLFLCDEFERCEKLRIELLTNPVRVQSALEFVAAGVVGLDKGGVKVRFGSQRSSNPPPVGDCLLNKWVVFQRRVDGSLSFAQNWDTYVKGFGNPHSNYWMGLNQLFASTASSEHNGYPDSSRCEMRVEANDLMDNHYWGQFKVFQVMSPDQFYRLRVMNQVLGTNLEQIPHHHEKQFSTYDKHNAGCPGSTCSRHYGYGGWWFPGITLNANGAYTTDTTVVHNPTYFSGMIHSKFVPLKSIVMMFRCK